MGILRKATEETKQIALDETDYIVVRADITKREFNTLAGSMPPVSEGGAGLSVAQASDFQKSLFETLVVGWSLNDGKPTVDDYESLAAEAGLVVDTKLAEHFESLLPTSAEGK
jgi:hypothetical protein